MADHSRRLARSIRVTAKPKKSKRIRNAPGARTRRTLVSPLKRLQDVLDVYEYTAAYEIVSAFNLVNGIPTQRDESFDDPLRPIQPDAADSHAAKRSDLMRVYPVFRRDLAGTPALLVLDAVLFQERSFVSLEREHQWRQSPSTARRHFATALKHFAALRGNVPRGVRDWKYVPPNPKGKAA